LGSGSCEEDDDGGPACVSADHDRRIQWWQEAKFGMFIHWGLYSVIGRHEWAMDMEGIPIPQYEMLAISEVRSKRLVTPFFRTPGGE
jgi:hypothetical protein